MAVMMPLGVSAFAPSVGAYYRQTSKEQFTTIDNGVPLASTTSQLALKQGASSPLSAADLYTKVPAEQSLAIKQLKAATVIDVPVIDKVQLTRSTAVKELVIVDTAVDDYATLIRDINPNVEVRFIDKTKPGLEQLNNILADYHGLTALHLVSHGADGVLQLGTDNVQEQDLKLGQSLSILEQVMADDADVLLYGCNLAKSAKGKALLELINNNAKVDVAASNDYTGAKQQNGDWELEVVRGNINAKQPFSEIALNNFAHVLAFTGTINFSTVTTAGALGGGSGTNAEFGGAGGYTLVLDGAAASTYGGFGRGYSSSGESQLTLSFSGNESFQPSSIYVYNISGLTDTFVVTADVAGSVNSGALNDSAGTTIDLSSFGAGVTKLYISVQDSSGYFSVDNFAVANVAPANSAPTIANLNGDSFTFTEGDAATLIDQGTAATVTDADGGDFNAGNMTVTITSGEDAAEDVLSLDTSGTVALAGTTASSNVSVGGTVIGTLGNNIAAGNDLVVNFNVNATPTNTQTLVQAVTFQDTDTDNPTTGARNVRLTVNDGDGGTSANSDITITVSAVNDAPTATGIPTDVTVTEDTASNVDLSAVTFADVDNASLTVTLAASAGTFSTPADGAGVGAGVTETLVNATTITLAGSPADINTYLDTASNIQYTGASNVNGNDAATMTINANDGTVNPLLGTVNLDITAVNDAPTDMTLSASSINQSATGVGADIGTLTSTDVDSGAFTYSLVADGASGSGSCGVGNDVDNASFQINTNILETVGATNASSYKICLQTSDGSASYQEAFTISVADDVAPTISAVSIANSAHKVGDVVTATITVSSDSDDYTTGSGGISGTIDGYTLGSLSKTNDTTYTASFTITDGGTDVAAGSNVPVNFTLADSTGNASGAFTTAISQASDAIYANIPTVNLTADSNTIAEDGGVSVLTATLSGSLNSLWPVDVSVGLAYSGTATVTTDYTKSNTITIASGSSTGTANVTGVGDTLYDAASAETVIVDINSLSVGNEGATNQQTINITDAEAAPTVSLSVGSNAIAENGGTSTITASLEHATYEDVTVNLIYSGTATSGSDYNNTVSASVTISGGSTSANAATGITGVDDVTEEGGETIIIDISSVSGGGATESGTQQQTVTILDDDDTTAPTISSVSVPANGTYATGQNLNFIVNTDEIVTVNTGGGTPRLVLNIGGVTKYASYLSGTGSQALVFRYVVEAGLNDADGVGLSALETNGGTIQDGAANNINTTLNSIGALGGVLVESVSPVVTGVSASTADGSYKAGDVINVTVTFDDTVTVNTTGGTPSLLLETGATDRAATYVSGSASNTLVFDYTVQAGDTSADLDYVATGSLSLNSGTIKDSNGNNASLTLAVPAAAGSLSDGKAIVIDTTAPVSAVVTTPAAPLTVTATTTSVSGTHGEDGVNVKIFKDADNNGTADDSNAPLASGTVAAGSWSLNAPLTLGTNNFVVMALDAAGNASGAVDVSTITRNSPPIVNSDPTGAVVISGSAIEGGTLTADTSSLGDGNGLGTFSYQWQSGGANVGSNSSSYQVVTFDIGNTITVTVNYTDGDGFDESVTSEPTSVVVNTNDSPTGAVLITGVVEEDQTLMADTSTIGDADGLGEFSFQWLRNGVAIEGATTTSYLLGDADVGSVISAIVSYIDGLGTSESLVSAETVAVANINDVPTGNVIISGSAEEDQTLTVSDTLADLDGLGEISYQWLRNAELVEGMTSASYTLTQVDVGATLSVQANYTDGYGQLESVTSAATEVVANVNDLPTGEVVISGVATSGEIVTASHTLSDEDGLGDINYQWQRNGEAISGANVDSYTLTEDDVEQSVTVVASYTDGQGTSESILSNAIIPISGTPIVGSKPEITASADVTVNATGLFTEVDMKTAIATDVEDGDLAVAVDSNSFFSPGSHIVTWSAVDSDGNEATDTQVINVIPLVGLSNNQNTAEGSTVNFNIILNGPAVEYPVIVPYTISGTADIDGSDHDLVDGSVTLESGQLTANVTVNIVDDGAGEGQETIVITLEEPTNAIIGTKASSQIAIFEGNVAPDVSLTATQGDGATRIVSQDGGLVTVSTTVKDPNQNDNHSYDWSNSDSALVDTDDDETTFTLDPSALSPGFYKLRIAVSDGDKVGQDRLKLRIDEVLPELNDQDDSDNDGISDKDEGTGDNDDDGIPDFLDSANLARNVVQERQADDTSFLMETEPGLALTLGEVAFRAKSAKTQVSEDDIVNHGNEGQGANKDESYEYSNGLFDFNVEELPIAGQSVSIVVAQFAPIPADAIYRKLMPSGWQDFVIDDNNSVASAFGSEGFCPPPGDVAYINGLTEGHWCVQLTIEDGGANDADGEVNQSIDDPGGIAVAVTGNTRPEAVDDAIDVKRNHNVYIDVLANDIDVDGDTLTITSANVDIGSVSIEDNQLLFTTELDHYGIANITYGISDSQGGSATGRVVINVVLNNAPVAVDDSAETDNETSIDINVLSNDSDADGDSLTVTQASAEHGSVTINADGSLHYTPASGFEGTDTLSYTISDGDEGESQAVVSVTVKASTPVVIDKPSHRKGGGSMLWILLIGILAVGTRRLAHIKR